MRKHVNDDDLFTKIPVVLELEGTCYSFMFLYGHGSWKIIAGKEMESDRLIEGSDIETIVEDHYSTLNDAIHHTICVIGSTHSIC